jgi:hypothetical protein
VTFEPSLEENPSWSRDGRWVYFKSDRSGLSQIWKVPFTGGPAVAVTRSEGSQALESSDGRLYFVRSAHAAGLWSMPASGGPEEFVVGGVREHRWDLVDGGCVFMDVVQIRREGRTAVRRFDFGTREMTTVFEMPRLPDAMIGFAASADARTVVWPQTEDEQGDIMVIDRWRR